MAHDIIMPMLGMAQDTGIIVAWQKQLGDPIKASDILMEIETDKSVVEVEAGHPNSSLGELHRQGQPHVAQADHPDAGVVRVDSFSQLLKPVHAPPSGAGGAASRPRK